MLKKYPLVFKKKTKTNHRTFRAVPMEQDPEHPRWEFVSLSPAPRITKKQASKPKHVHRRIVGVRHDPYSNYLGNWRDGKTSEFIIETPNTLNKSLSQNMQVRRTHSSPSHFSAVPSPKGNVSKRFTFCETESNSTSPDRTFDAQNQPDTSPPGFIRATRMISSPGLLSGGSRVTRTLSNNEQENFIAPNTDSTTSAYHTTTPQLGMSTEFCSVHSSDQYFPNSVYHH